MLVFCGRPLVRFILLVSVHPIGRHRAKVQRGQIAQCISIWNDAHSISAITYTTTHPMGVL